MYGDHPQFQNFPNITKGRRGDVLTNMLVRIYLWDAMGWKFC
jgi:hypothetical protein